MTRKPKPEGLAAKSFVGAVPSFPIVGIGASAGGLEALEVFLRRFPDKSGLGFVVVQHLDPTHKGMLVELLSRATTMKVVQARDRLRVEPNRVYVIPPNKDLSVLHGVLHLLAPAAPRGLRLGHGLGWDPGSFRHQGERGRGVRAGPCLRQVRLHAQERD